MSNENSVNFEGQGVALDAYSRVAQKALSVRLTANQVGTSAFDTGLVLPAGAVVEGVYINVITAEATGTTKTLDVGITADGDGFLDGVSVASTGVVKGTLTNGGVTLGVNLLAYSATSSANPVPEPYVNATATAVTVTAGAANFAELVADLVVIYKEISAS